MGRKIMIFEAKVLAVTFLVTFALLAFILFTAVVFFGGSL